MTDFEKKIQQSIGAEYRLVEKEGSSNKVTIKHEPCGIEYKATLGSLYRGFSKCKHCEKESKAVEFKNRFRSLLGEDYTLITDYIGSKRKVTIHHKTCGSNYRVTPASISRGSKCPECSRALVTKLQTKSREQFISEVNELGKGEYKLVGEYTNSKNSVTLKHLRCGGEYHVRPDSFLRGSRCRMCTHRRYSKEYRKTTEQYRKEIEDLTKGEYELVGEYLKTSEYVTIHHKPCGNKYKVYPFMFKRGSRCPNCNLSKGEKLVEDSLTQLGVKFIKQAEFPGLVRLNSLSYDFYLPDKGVVIEYQGIQHYQPVELFGGEEPFRIQQINDDIKRKYAKDNNLKLVEIPYTIATNHEIDTILKEVLQLP